MLRLTMVMVFMLMNFLLVPCYCQVAYAGWSTVDIGDVDNDLWAVWGSSENNVYAMGTNGINLRYDGNSEGEWLILPAISP